MKKRFIFDLDGTLLHGDFNVERDYFKSVLNEEDSEKFLLLYFEKLLEYESMLEYLKSKDKSLVVLTNWFKYTQEERLRNAGILEFFDGVYAGDLNLKPNKESYLNACGNYHVNECIMIGDTIEKDVIGPNKFGIDSIYYNPENKEYDKSKILSINSFDKIKEMF